MLNALPIIGKELHELATRRKTYWLRLLFLGIVSFFFFRTYDTVSHFDFLTAQLGTGRWFFRPLFYTQFALILCAVPALVATAVTSEREADTIQLLLTVPLSDSSILLQKLFVRLVPVFTLIFLTMPLFGFAYTLGGLSLSTILIATGHSLFAAFCAGLVALAVSSTRKSSAAAIILSYLILFIPSIIYGANIDFQPEDYLSLIILLGFMMAILAMICLGIAHRYFRPVSLNQPTVDDFYAPDDVRRKNVFTTRNPMPGREHAIAWLEQIKSKHSLQQYAALTISVGAITAIIAAIEDNAYAIPLLFMVVILSISVFFRFQRAASQFRQNQLLPILLTTPIPRDAIITHFIQGRKFVLDQSFITLGLCCLGAMIGGSGDGHIVLASLVTLGATWIYFRSIAWFATAMSLITRNNLQAIVFGLGIMILLLFVLPGIFRGNVAEYWNPLFLAYIIIDLEYMIRGGNVRAPFPVITVLLHFACSAVVLFSLRALVIDLAPRQLLRAANKH